MINTFTLGVVNAFIQNFVEIESVDSDIGTFAKIVFFMDKTCSFFFSRVSESSCRSQIKRKTGNQENR